MVQYGNEGDGELIELKLGADGQEITNQPSPEGPVKIVDLLKPKPMDFSVRKKSESCRMAKKKRI